MQGNVTKFTEAEIIAAMETYQVLCKRRDEALRSDRTGRGDVPMLEVLGDSMAQDMLAYLK